ncbi:hypothetical protein KSS87_013204 [Heliosperma pusillum]|nr:hypothetical protein KSS87_013204 [Heliosperma pusillum]
MATQNMKKGNINDVQELKNSIIPDRFVRDVDERPLLPTLSNTILNQVPIIDLAKISNGDLSEISNLALACQDWGFFQVINHDIGEKLLESIEKMAMEFFMLPLQEKQKYQMTAGAFQGYGQAFVFSDQQKLDWCNMFALGVNPPFIRNPNLWPTKPPNFSETIELYQSEIGKLCKKVLRYIAMSLNVRAEVFEEIFGEVVQAIRMNYYPPCPRPDLVLGLSPHSDGSAITILHQKKDSSVGLQFLKDGNWVSLQPVPNSLVVNIGDTIEVLTNGKYKSIEHRAVTNEVKDRLSIVTFYAPSYQVELGPMSEFVNQNNPIKYRYYNHGEYSRHYVSHKLQGKRTLEFAKLTTDAMA